MRLDSVDDLRGIYRQPGRGPVDKVIHRLDEHCADFLARSPFFVLSTASSDGICDGSPKGGPAGFVRVLDEQRLAWADYSGNSGSPAEPTAPSEAADAGQVWSTSGSRSQNRNGRQALTNAFADLAPFRAT